MKKKLVSILLCAAMTATLLAGCGSSADTAADSGAAEETTEAAAEETTEAAAEETTEAAADETEEAVAAEEEIPTSTFGDANGTHLEMWTFVELHGQHYGKMAEIWNEQNPDRTIEITCTTYPYGDMHTKLLTSLEAGTGAPDICDVEVGQYPNVVAGLDQWLVPLDDAASPYMATMVPARMQTYQGEDGHYYGAPYHVGATAMYYNVAAMSEAMGISQDEVIAKIDAVVTWDDYVALGEEYKTAIADDSKYWTSVDTGGVDWLWIAMAEYGEDWTGGFEGPANVQLDSVKNMLSMQQEWLKSGLAQISPDGHVDLEAGFQNIMDHNIVSFPKALWYMSRFTNYMPEESGNWYIAKCPVFEVGQKCSVGIGGTGTVVTQQSEAKELAAEFLCWAKMSDEGEQNIWDTLGFDVCNTAQWGVDAFAHDDNNQFNQYFINYPYDVLNEIGMDNIGKISVVAISPTINEYACTTTLNEVLEDPDYSIDDALQEFQDAVDLEQ
ncbi:MAG: extracellular solute-binding protein [Lachnospiraceae bacterium]|nr:extracellular solute-binding protein [Lachnospiraceae bacterium]